MYLSNTPTTLKTEYPYKLCERTPLHSFFIFPITTCRTQNSSDTPKFMRTANRQSKALRAIILSSGILPKSEMNGGDEKTVSDYSDDDVADEEEMLGQTSFFENNPYGVIMAKQTIYNAGIYVRLSQEDMRAGESLSIENQKLILTKYVKEQGWNLVDTYVDDGWSGTDFDRPAVQRLLSDAQSRKINLIICKDLSRFGRNYIEVGRYVDYIFPSYNIRFIALNDNVDTASKDT